MYGPITSNRITYDEFRTLMCDMERRDACRTKYEDYVSSTESENQKDILLGFVMIAATIGIYFIVRPQFRPQSLPLSDFSALKTQDNHLNRA